MGYKDMVLGQLTQTAIDERNNVYFKMAQEVEKVYSKAQAFDEIKEFIIEKLKEEEEKSRILLDNYDYGLYQAYNKVDDIIQEHMTDIEVEEDKQND
ncbi:hypothetical protein BUZ69_10310 [Staphylococcus saprophyticus]|uniref:hypothetical protein n=1 Tax=Staphylococcus saprophyticus TaxID=29385 RepID=UPI000D1F5AE2|nr:hypothetical protein [Staphylococcus saprophyticus]PTK45458.1 hypothetical protein BUZ69_10310 [Staphylococcus saprophyticus]